MKCLCPTGGFTQSLVVTHVTSSVEGERNVLTDVGSSHGGPSFRINRWSSIILVFTSFGNFIGLNLLYVLKRLIYTYYPPFQYYIYVLSNYVS